MTEQIDLAFTFQIHETVRVESPKVIEKLHLTKRVNSPCGQIDM